MLAWPELAFPARRDENFRISKPAPKPKIGRIRRTLRLLLLLVLLAVLSLLIPAVFRLALRQLIALEAWRHGVQVEIARIEGSLYEPVVLIRSQWTFRSRAGCITRFDVTRAEAEFSWEELLPGHSQHWFRRLALETVIGKVQLPPVSPVGLPLRPQDEEKPAWYPVPTRVEAQGVDLLVQSEGDYVHLEESRLLISEQQPGEIEIGRFIVKQPILTRTFHNIHGTTALQEGRVQIAGLQLDPAVQVRSFSADVREIARGRLDMELQIEAFGGKIHAQAETIPHERGTELEASGNFNQIAIAPLAAFLGITDAAGGNIKVGQFNFRGSPRDFWRSSLTLRLEATDFQWETRQWDSLTLGATLLDGRVQIPELELHQGHNRLSLTGDVALPNGTRPWWQSDFNCRIAAHFENLTELSALLLPDFRYAAGQMSITGSVQSKAQLYDGQLIVTGSHLAWRSTPIQELSAAILLAGKELQVANLSLRNKDDSLTAQGVFNLDDARLYHGELRASVEDLATYADILQKPLVPASLAGGAALHWTGQGQAEGQSGRFTARLRHLRPLTPAPSRLHPVDAELEGSYAPSSVKFSRLDLADESCALAAQVEIAARSVNFSSLRLTHGNDVWLEGEALLPLEIWSAWPNGQFPKLAEEAPVKVHLKAAGLQLATAARLTGWDWPIAGAVTGELTTAGKLGALKGAGQLRLDGGRLPLEGDAVPTLFSGDFTLADQLVTTTNIVLAKGSGHVEAQAQLDLASFRDPAVRGIVGAHPELVDGVFPAGTLDTIKTSSPEGSGQEVALPWFSGLLWPVVAPDGRTVPGQLKVRLSPGPLSFEGPLSSALLRGTCEITGWELGGHSEISGLWREGAFAPLPAVLKFPALLAGWKLDIGLGAPSARSPAPVAETPSGEGSPSWAAPQLRLTGTGAVPLLTGKVQFGLLPARLGSLPVTLRGEIAFREGFPRDPTLDLHAAGTLESLPFNAWLVGPLTRHIGFFDSEVARATALGGQPPAGAFPPWAVFSNEIPPTAPAKNP